MDLAKINILEGPWVDKAYYSEILPKITAARIPVQRFCYLPISQASNAKYWGELRSSSSKFNIVSIDYRHIFLDDDTFLQYAKNISSIPFDAIVIGENIFSETSEFFDESLFDKKIYSRTKILCEIIRKKQKKTVLVSPSISFDQTYKSRYLDYFISHRNLFDVWNVQCCDDFKEQDIAFLSSFLNEILSILNKPVWFTKWAIPSCETKIENKQSMEVSSWRPSTYNQAAMKMRLVFSAMEKITKGNSKWFYVGIGPDAYSPTSTVPDTLWNSYPLYVDNSSALVWKPQHFLGGYNYKNKIKTPQIETLLSLCKEHNA